MLRPRSRASPRRSKGPARRSTRSLPLSMRRARTAPASPPFSPRTRIAKTAKAASPTASARCRHVHRGSLRRPDLRLAARALFLFVALLGSLAQAAENPEIAKRRAAERKAFTDAEIFKGFFATAFGAEMRIAGRVDRIRKYNLPVRVFVENRAQPDRRTQVAEVV